MEKYQVLNQLSQLFIGLNLNVVKDSDNPQEIERDHYYILQSVDVDKIRSNIRLAQTRSDTGYFEYLTDFLNSHNIRYDHDLHSQDPAEFCLKKRAIRIQRRTTGIQKRQPSKTLAKIIGSNDPVYRHVVIQKINQYIKDHAVQDTIDRCLLNAESNPDIKTLYDEAKKETTSFKYSLYELPKVLNYHLV